MNPQNFFNNKENDVIRGIWYNPNIPREREPEGPPPVRNNPPPYRYICSCVPPKECECPRVLKDK